MIKKTLVTTALGALMSANVAIAGPFAIDVGYDVDGDGSSVTSSVDELGYTGTTATSIYLGDPSVAGTVVVDTNIQTELDSYGFADGTHTAIDGSTGLTFYDPNDLGDRNVDALNFSPGTTPNGNGFVSGEGGFPNNYGNPGAEGPTWGLTYDYLITGVTTSTGVEYNGGFFDVFFEDGSSRTQVLRLNVTDSVLAAANLNIFGDVSFDFDSNGTDDAGGDAFLENFFVDLDNGKTFYDLWKAGYDMGELMTIRWDLNTDVVPPLPGEDELVAFVGDEGPVLIRQSSLNGQVAFVPEPWTLGLFGVGLLALGFVARRRARS